jgi:alpha-beta hydrolase superfamily lysophospholipase
MGATPEREAAMPPPDPGEIVTVQSTDGARLKGRIWRASSGGPLLVAAHGVMSHSLWFHELAVELRALGISLLAFDRRGAGMAREEPGEPVDEKVLADDLDAWLDLARTITDDIHLVGFCWGSNYVLHYLGKHPRAARSLILIAPGVVPSKKVAIHRSPETHSPEEQLPIPLKLEDFTHGPALDGFLRSDPLRLTHTSARFVDIQNRIGRFSAIQLVRVRLPLLTIFAATDDISDNEKTRAYLAKTSIAPKEVIELPGRHGIIFDAPRDLAAACRGWLDRLTPTDPSNV